MSDIRPWFPARPGTGSGGWRDSVAPVACFLVCWVGVLAAVAPSELAAQQAPVPEALRRLETLAGSWTTDRVEFLAPDGSTRRESRAYARNALELGGRVMAHQGRLAEPEVETRGWYYWDEDARQLRMASVSNSGRYDEFRGGWEGDRLVMVARGPAGSGRAFRMTHSQIAADGFLETMEVSEDDGETWRMTSRQRMRRVDAASILAALDAYEGRWRSDEKSGPAGEAFHFLYEERWLDESRTVATIHIERIAADGTASTVFRGFKGREPDGQGVYWVAASPSGRASRGLVLLEGSNLVTQYEGWTADGDTVEVRDVFGPVEDGAFVSRTFLRRSSAEDWRQIGEDRWERIPGSH